jgi:hypothetical protein
LGQKGKQQFPGLRNALIRQRSQCRSAPNYVIFLRLGKPLPLPEGLTTAVVRHFQAVLRHAVH